MNTIPKTIVTMKNNENNASESQRNMNRPKEAATILPKMNNTNNINNNNINIHKNEHNIVNNIVLTKFFLTISRQILNNCNNIVVVQNNNVIIVYNILYI